MIDDLIKVPVLMSHLNILRLLKLDSILNPVIELGIDGYKKEHQNVRKTDGKIRPH